MLTQTLKLNYNSTQARTLINSRSWLKRIFSGTNGTWKSYLQHILSSAGGLFFFNCNYNISHYTIPSQFYRKLLESHNLE